MNKNYISQFSRMLLILLFLIGHSSGQSGANFRLKKSELTAGGGSASSTNLVLLKSAIAGFAAGSAQSQSFLLNSATIVTSVIDSAHLRAIAPQYFRLLQNYPNPFNPETTIEYELPEKANVQINIFNGIGQLVKTFTPGSQPPGQHRLVWNGKNDKDQSLPSGLYYYQIKAGSFSDIRKMLLLK